jgi:hypothetical protein
MNPESSMILPFQNFASSTGRVLLMSAAIFAGALTPSPSQETPRPEFPAGIRIPAAARGKAAIVALGNRLPEVASHYRKTPEELRALFRADHCLQINTEGRLCYAC